MLIRGPQFKSGTIDSDRFVSPLGLVLTRITVDLAATGTSAIYTVPAGKTALVQGIVFRALGAAGSDPTVSVGINPSTDNIFDSQQLVNFPTVGNLFTLWNDKGVSTISNAADQIDLNVVVASSLTAEVFVLGFLL
jgi:hypothetical protein